MTPVIRPATPADADFAAPLIQQTIGPIGHALTGEETDGAAAAVIAALFRQPGNRLSFQNTLLLEEGGERLGLAVVYPGEWAAALDEPLRARLRGLGLPADFETEAMPDELYLDTLAAQPHARGRGLGGLLLNACAARATALGLPRVGLLVEDGNPAARLYARQGFVPLERRKLAGHLYTHLVRPVG